MQEQVPKTTWSPIVPVDTRPERLQRVTVCTRPFRAAGPRLEAERLGRKLLVHNYGHGGSGWSLSWGSAALVVPMVLGERAGEVAVVGCGALGLTAAVALQRAGARVTVYARERPAATRSARATGSWTPDARVALAGSVEPAFAERWEQMARHSFRAFHDLLGLPDEPVKRQRRFLLSEDDPETTLAERLAADPIGFLHLEHRLSDLWPPVRDSGPGQSPFGALYCREVEIYRFDLTAYAEHLLREFEDRGGVLQTREFRSPAELLSLPESVIVNCTGYGARALFNDRSLVPIRGQLSWLPAQPEVDYSLQWRNLNMVARPDGIVVQFGGGGDAAGWQDASEVPDAEEARGTLQALAALQAQMAAAPTVRV